MRDKKKHFLEILRIELTDLREDLNILIQNCKEDFCCRKITEHVFLENTTLFQNELLGVEEFSILMNQIDLEKQENLDEMITKLKNDFEIIRRANEIAPAVKICIERKILKVSQYVKQ